MQNILVIGGTRGVGFEIALSFAKQGANVAILGKTVIEHPKLPGTLLTAKDELLNAGANQVLALECDVRNVDMLKTVIDEVGATFKSLDLLVNNASALYLLKTADITLSKFNLMHEVIVRSSLFATKYSLDLLKLSKKPNIVNIAPPITLLPKWFASHTFYTVCKYSSAMLVIGFAEELREYNISVNAVWPKTLLATAAVKNLLGGTVAMNSSRHPRIMADAIQTLIQKTCTGEFFLDEDLVTNIEQYNIVPNSKLITDLYVEE